MGRIGGVGFGAVVLVVGAVLAACGGVPAASRPVSTSKHHASSTTSSTIPPTVPPSTEPPPTTVPPPPPTTIPPTTTTIAPKPIDPLSETCDSAANPGSCYAQAACKEWSTVDQTIDTAALSNNLGRIFRMQTSTNYANMLSDATLAAQNDPRWESLNNHAKAIDSAIDSATPGTPTSIRQIPYASQQMGSVCTSSVTS